MKKFFYSLAAIVSNFFLLSAAHAVTISMAIPGGPNAYPTSTGPGGFVANFYQFALMIGGVLAFGVIVYGGVRYMASAGNPSGQSDAKEWIEAALLGLLLLVGAYFILNVVNPQLTNLVPPTLTPVNIQTPAAATTQTEIQTAIAACVAACQDASCTAACNAQGSSLQSAFSGACSANTCPSGQTCQNDGSGGHMCLNINPLSTNPLGSTPAGDYSSCAQANCASGKNCVVDLSNSKYYTCM
ncbi:MAG: hypothetical protein ABR884_00230 [Minisyncoccia bacterium]|jgi:hypothetical protein